MKRPDDIAWLAERPIAHRGYHDGDARIENSLGAFRAAVEKGFAIECDVRPTAGGEVVVFHDETLDRLTGETGLVRERTLSELRGLRLGRTTDTIPSLPDMLDVIDGAVPVVIELKGFEPEQQRFVASVAKALSGYRGRAAIMSFDHALVKAFAQDAPGVPGGLTAEGVSDDAMSRHERVVDLVDFVSYGVDDLPNGFVEGFRSSGRPVITWTVRTPEQVRLTFDHADQMTFEGFDPFIGA